MPGKDKNPAPDARLLAPELRIPGRACWAVRRNAYKHRSADAWPAQGPMHGTLQSSYYDHRSDGNNPVAFFLPDKIPSGSRPDGMEWHISNLELAADEASARSLLRDQAIAYAAELRLEASMLDGIAAGLLGENKSGEEGA